MKITDIKQQARRVDRYSIYVDGNYAFSLSDDELKSIGLKIGLEFTNNELDGLKNRAVLDKAYDRALNLIARRPRSEWELRDYLKRKDYDSGTVDEVIGRLRERGYVNDSDFARRWIENRRLLKATSKRRLRQELKQKRVPDDMIDQALAEDETDERAVLSELVERKRKQIRYQDDLKLMQYLSRQGYSYDDIKSALSGD